MSPRQRDSLFSSCLLTCALVTLVWMSDLCVAVQPPVITRELQSEFGIEGGVIVFVCQASGDPEPSFRWEKGSRNAQNTRSEIFPMPFGSVLRIEPLRDGRDDGEFHCIASNIAGIARSTASLQIYTSTSIPAGFPVITRDPVLDVVEKGFPILLHCEAEGNPDPEIIWFKEYIPVDLSTERVYLTPAGLYISVSEISDRGKYQCAARNSAGTRFSKAALLYIRVRRVAPRFTIFPETQEVVPGGNVNLTCAANGFPMPVIKWMKGDENLSGPDDTLPRGRSVLVLKNVRETAEYRCYAMSDLGQIERTVTVTIRTSDWCSATDPIPCPGVECVNLLSRAQCVCSYYYALMPDGRTCVKAYASRPTVLIASRDRLLSVETLFNTVGDVEGDWKNTTSVIVDFNSRYMFVNDHTKRTVERYNTSGGGYLRDFVIANRTILSANAGSVEGMAYDWIYKNLYWVSEEGQEIIAIPFDGRFPAVVVLGGLGQPRDVAVDPKERFMYWTDWGDSPMIGKAGLDGSQPTQLVNTSIVWPNGLVLDYETRRVYWVDSRLDRMEYIGFGGDGRRVVIQYNLAMRNPFGIAIYEDQVYWIDRQLMTLSSANKFTGEISREIRLGTTPMDMDIIGLFPEPLHYDVVNYCDVNPGCSHHCLPSPASPTNFTCACPPMAHLDTDGRTCLCDNGKLLLSDGEGCQKEPIHVRGLTSGYLADHGLNFDMRCIVSEDEGVICTPRGAKEATVADPEGRYECRAPRN